MIKVAFGRQEGMAVTNQLDADSIRAAVAHAEQIAKTAKPTEDHLPPLGKQQYPRSAWYTQKRRRPVPGSDWRKWRRQSAISRRKG